MKKNDNTNTYPWQFAPVGGSVRVNLRSGEDIRHLPELDRKMWTVLSCPVEGLEFDARTLRWIDADGDGKIRVDEVIDTAAWITRILRHPDRLLGGEDRLPLSEFNTDDPDGARLQASARQILANLKIDKDSIALEDTADSTRIFADTAFNGDGVITPASTDDAALATLIETMAGIHGTPDRSGATGVTAAQIEAFYAAAADYLAWLERGTDEVFPFGEGTVDALAAVEAVRDKVADFFMRVRLIGFDPAVADKIDVSADAIGAIAGNLADATGEIALQPIAKPGPGALLPLAEGVNPAWKDALSRIAALLPEGKAFLTEDEWNALTARFAPYTAWLADKQGADVEPLGADALKALLADNRKDDLLALVEKDQAEEANARSIEEVDKVLCLYRNFYRFLNNYVVLSDFYDPDRQAVFQAGRLYIDQRSTDLCIKVSGPSPEISGLSGMYILYCTCTSEKLGKTFQIAAILTDGDVDGLREGKNAIFYDRDGNDYTAKVTAIVDNPISVRQAFWSPYKKFVRTISDRIDAKAAEKNEKSMAGITEAASATADGKAPAAPFDITKFATIGMAVGLLGTALAGIVAVFKGLTLWHLLLIVAILMLLISGPSVFIAWRKLHRRDLGPVLNANGWAINASALVNVKFGRTLTSLARYPKLTAVDPQARKQARRRTFWTWLCAIVVVGGLGLWLANILAPMGLRSPLPCYRETVEAIDPVDAADEAGPVTADAAAPAAQETADDE